MRDFQTIQERINAKADAELENKIGKIMRPLREFTGHDNCGLYYLDSDGETYHQTNSNTAARLLGEHLVSINEEGNRGAASREFLSKMDKMHEQFDEMVGFEDE